MVSTRSRARRASTPLSSPPPSLTPNPQSSPLPTQADSPAGTIYGDPPSDLPESDDDYDSDDDSDSDHEVRCNRHTSELATYCNALTYARKKCRNKGRIAVEGFFPVCGQHTWHKKRAGRCQAVEKCGRLCNRLAAHTPPYFLCAKHENGTNTIPCYIMQLPTELRLMIFRYVLPDVIKARYFETNQAVLLRVNRQFYEEASFILYSESKFEAIVEATTIDLFGRRWCRESSATYSNDLNKTLCQGGAQRIRHLQVSVKLGDTSGKIKGIGGLGGPGIIHEEYDLYMVRDSVRKLVELLSPPHLESTSVALKHLKVKPEPSHKQDWRSDETIAAIFCVLEPFLALTPIEDATLLPPPKPTVWSWRHQGSAAIIGDIHKSEEYRRLRKQWLRSIKSSVSSLNIVRKPRKAAAAIAIAFGKIEDFAAVIYSQDSAHFKDSAASKHGWTSSSFQGIERVLHIARVAYEDGDLELLQKIHEAIMKRWVNAHRQQQRSLAAVAAKVAHMFDGDISSQDGYDLKAFEFEEVIAVEDAAKFDHMWPELTVRSVILKLKEPRVTVEEEGVRIIVRKDGNEQVRLRTPAMVRQLRGYKRGNA